MASAAQITANQANARNSTGPRTAEGKAASARNNTSHGLCSKDFVILAGQEEEFQEFITGLRADIAPVGALEHELFAQHAHAAWGLRRCRRAEVATQLDPSCLGKDPLLDSGMANRLKRIDLYARRAERTFHKSLNELKAIQVVRKRLEILSAKEGNPPKSTLLADPAKLMDQIRICAQADNYVRTQKVAKAMRDAEIATGIPQNVEQQLQPLLKKFQEELAKATA